MTDWLDDVLVEMPVERDAHWRSKALGGKAAVSEVLRKWHSRRQITFDVDATFAERFERTARARNMTRVEFLISVVEPHLDG